MPRQINLAVLGAQVLLGTAVPADDVQLRLLCPMPATPAAQYQTDSAYITTQLGPLHVPAGRWLDDHGQRQLFQVTSSSSRFH